MKKIIIIVFAIVALASTAKAESQDAASRERNRYLIDTNATTTTSGYTASYIGQHLVGAKGSSNTVWVAMRATATNWQQIATDNSARP